jgi:hypothetical protein
MIRSRFQFLVNHKQTKLVRLRCGKMCTPLVLRNIDLAFSPEHGPERSLCLISRWRRQHGVASRSFCDSRLLLLSVVCRCPSPSNESRRHGHLNPDSRVHKIQRKEVATDLEPHSLSLLEQLAVQLRTGSEAAPPNLADSTQASVDLIWRWITQVPSASSTMFGAISPRRISSKSTNTATTEHYGYS